MSLYKSLVWRSSLGDLLHYWITPRCRLSLLRCSLWPLLLIISAIISQRRSLMLPFTLLFDRQYLLQISFKQYSALFFLHSFFLWWTSQIILSYEMSNWSQPLNSGTILGVDLNILKYFSLITLIWQFVSNLDFLYHP